MVLGLRATGFAVRGNRHTDATNGTNERGAPRRRTLTGGKIVYGDGAYTYDCTIREISTSGARIGIAGGIVIPRAFFLIDQKRGTAFEAELVWRNGTQWFHRQLYLILDENVGIFVSQNSASEDHSDIRAPLFRSFMDRYFLAGTLIINDPEPVHRRWQCAGYAGLLVARR